ncbi:hypothetical protein D3C72_2027240 [compost metagenome]
MVPVVAELLSEEEQQHGQRTVDLDREEAVLPGKREHRRGQRQRQQRQQLAADQIGQRQGDFMPGIGLALTVRLACQHEGFDQRDRHDKRRDAEGECSEVVHVGSSAVRWDAWLAALSACCVGEANVVAGPVRRHPAIISPYVMPGGPRAV